MTDHNEKIFKQKFHDTFGKKPEGLITAPGRVNLIGEHIDYNGCPVLPFALDRVISGLFCAGEDVELVNGDSRFPPRHFALESAGEPFPSGDWGNYVKAAVWGIMTHFPGRKKWQGMKLLVQGNIPPAAGLSSSSALVVLSALGFLAANRITMDPLDLAELTADAERFVGTRGGGMDQGACLCGKKEHALLIHFHPLIVEEKKLPQDVEFLVAHSLVQAAKSSDVRHQFNLRAASCRIGTVIAEHYLQANGYGDRKLIRVGDLPEVFLQTHPHASLDELFYHSGLYQREELSHLTGVSIRGLTDMMGLEEFPAEGIPVRWRMRHVFTEWERVNRFCLALSSSDSAAMGHLMRLSHESCRDDYEISCPELEELVDTAYKCGALGARLTGAGFGGCVISLVEKGRSGELMEGLKTHYYSRKKEVLNLFPGAAIEDILFTARASDGANVSRL